MATCLVFGAAPIPLAAQFTSADVAGVSGCSPTFSNATPAVVTCGTVVPGNTAGFASASYGLLGASASAGSATANVISIAQFGDRTTIFGPPVAGIFFGVTATIDGTITGLVPRSGTQASGRLNASLLDTSCVAQITQNGTFQTSSICLVPLIPNSTNTIGFSYTLTVQAKFGTGVVADFSQTARITAVGLYDVNYAGGRGHQAARLSEPV
jgi:hypothetical protein